METVLPGFTLHPLDDGWTPLQAFVVVKALDLTGEPVWVFRTSEAFNLEELLGALTRLNRSKQHRPVAASVGDRRGLRLVSSSRGPSGVCC